MNTRNFIAIDLGATSGRVILTSVGDDGMRMECVHRFKTPLLNVFGKFYWNIYSIYEEVVKGLGLIGNRGLKIESVGVDGWGVDMVGIAKDGSLCNLPRSYRDPYTQSIQPRFFKKMPREELYRRTGVQTMDINTVFQLYALHREKSSALDNARHLLFIPDAISYLLTGQKYCEHSILSTSGFADPYKRKVDKHVLSVCKVKKNRIPSIVMPGKKIGRLNASIGRQTGLGQVPVIAVAGHDTASAIAAVPASDKGFAYLSSGTWSLMGIECDSPIITEKTSEYNLTNEGGVNGTVTLLKNITGLWLLEQCLLKWKLEDKDYGYQEVAEMASSCPPSPRPIDVDDPSFASPTDMPAAIAAYCREHGITVPADDAHVIRLIYDSLTSKYSSTLSELRSLSPEPIRVLHVIGGGSRNDFLNQLTANACNIPVIAGPAECTAVGNVMVQARSSGMFSGLQEMRDYIRRNVTTKTYTPSL